MAVVSAQSYDQELQETKEDLPCGRKDVSVQKFWGDSWLPLQDVMEIVDEDRPQSLQLWLTRSLCYLEKRGSACRRRRIQLQCTQGD
jgi:hypothetical protein